ncbi:bile salt-activated lipase-like [Battus philenor]|uniref:bile salt-activated lipase-like n=1 Tax=Battus philenor TaxID=42288 RepID=UPI0035CF05EA
MKYKYLSLFTLFAANLVDQPAPEVTIAQGILSGKTSADGSFFEYIGIPYATTNSNTRFKAPGPPPSWSGVYKAVDEIHFCPQVLLINVIGSEDCLKVNVYVPAVRRKPLPVMVYIHGGAFLFGGGGKLFFGPDFLVKKDVILVTFNYRVGVLGFLCLRTKDVPGNAGLKDQIAALRWVKKNIAAFGGDPDNVTLFGESAGAASVSLLLATNSVDGLINRAIMQSGSSIAMWALNRNPLQVASLLAKSLGYDTEDPSKLHEIFSQVSYKELVGAKVEKPITKYLDTPLLYLPCIEKSIPGEESVINDLPYNMLNKKNKSIPLIYGTNSNEGYFIANQDTDEWIEGINERYLFASDLQFESEEIAEMENLKFKKFYFDNEKISPNKLLNLSEVYGHLYFKIPPILESEIMTEKTDARIYNYYFEYEGGRNFLKKISKFAKEKGASHGDELFYLFNAMLQPFRINQRDANFIDTITTLWTNFAKYGDPTPKSKDSKFQWIPSRKNQKNFLYINEKLRMGPLPEPEAYSLWKYIYDKYRNFKLY